VARSTPRQNLSLGEAQRSDAGQSTGYGGRDPEHGRPERPHDVDHRRRNFNSTRLFRWRYTPIGDWGSEEPVSALLDEDFLNTGNGVRNPQVAGTDAEGNLLVIWEERDAASSGMGRIQARRFHAG
jgi:hypothetical protein